MAGPVTVGNHWLNATVRLDPMNPIAYSNRGDTFRVKDEYGRTLIDRAAVIWRKPKIAAVVRGFEL